MFDLSQPLICELPLDVNQCIKNNIHNRTESDIRSSIEDLKSNPTPSPYIILDCEPLFNNADDVEDISDVDENADSLDAISDEDDGGREKADEQTEDIDDGSDDEPLNEVSTIPSKQKCTFVSVSLL